MHKFLVVVLLASAAGCDQSVVGPGDDPVSGASRVIVDHETGCQYIGRTGGGITPRLDADGKHICEGLGDE